MYFDQFYNALSYFIIFSSIPAFFIIKKLVKKMSYEQLLKIKSCISTVVYLFISVILCTATFFKIQYMSTFIDIALFSIATLVYSLVDIFYFQEVKKEHIWNLQSQFIRNGNKDSLFREKMLKGDYVQTKEHKKERYSIIKTENDGECIYIGGEEKLALKPKKAMPSFLLKFYAKCLSLGMEELPIFESGESLEKVVKNYQFFKPSAIYLFIQKHKKAVEKIILAILMILLLLFIYYLIAASQNWFGLEDWIKQEIQ